MLMICITQICRNITAEGVVEYVQGTNYILGSWHGGIQLPENKTEIRGYILPNPNSLKEAVLLYDDVMYYYNETEITLLQKKRFSLFERHAISDGVLKILDPVDAKIWYFDLQRDEKYIYGISNKCTRLLLRIGLHNDITFLGSFALINGLQKSYINFNYHSSSNFISCNIQTIKPDNQLKQKYNKHHTNQNNHDAFNADSLQIYSQLQKMAFNIHSTNESFYCVENNLVAYTHKIVFGPGGNGLRLPQELTVNYSEQQSSKQHFGIVPELCLSQISLTQSNQTQKIQKQHHACQDQLHSCKQQLHNLEQDVKNQETDIQLLKQRLISCQQENKLKQQQNAKRILNNKQDDKQNNTANQKSKNLKLNSHINKCEHLEKQLRELYAQQQNNLNITTNPTNNIVKAVKFEAVLLIFAVCTYSSFGIIWFIMW